MILGLGPVVRVWVRGVIMMIKVWLLIHDNHAAFPGSIVVCSCKTVRTNIKHDKSSSNDGVLTSKVCIEICLVERNIRIIALWGRDKVNSALHWVLERIRHAVLVKTLLWVELIGSLSSRAQSSFDTSLFNREEYSSFGRR